ncbi:MAG: peptidylprolyl isomerase [Maricaulis sp.]|nr:peptidylprolyl isomerase [Maricaulis sp.]HAQ33795.1 peptidylprolyl isomerase [Alphaproteobacteria bacterium]|tara:strand:+ start:192 stop:818 length:627 start_codon:yes stop_codon:yes gene_type:complete
MIRILTLVTVIALAACSGSAPGSNERTVTAVIATEAGDITVELYPDRAPLSVANFIAHAEAGHFDGASFYRTVRADNDRPEARIDVIQGGVDFDGLPGAVPIAHERTDETGLTHRRGAISMARDAPGTASTEFFIVIHDSVILDAGPGGRHPDGEGFAVFGYVTDGMDVAEAIWSAPTGGADAPEGYAAQWLDPAVGIRSVVVENGGR